MQAVDGPQTPPMWEMSIGFSARGPVVRLVAAVVLFGAYYAATDGVLAAIGSAMLPAAVRGSGLALLTSVTNVGRLVASVSFGALWTWVGLTSAIAIFATALLVALAMARGTLRDASVPAAQ